MTGTPQNLPTHDRGLSRTCLQEERDCLRIAETGQLCFLHPRGWSPSRSLLHQFVDLPASAGMVQAATTPRWPPATAPCTLHPAPCTREDRPRTCALCADGDGPYLETWAQPDSACSSHPGMVPTSCPANGSGTRCSPYPRGRSRDAPRALGPGADSNRCSPHPRGCSQRSIDEAQ